MYYVLLANHVDRQMVLGALRDQEVISVFHYVPLHSSPAGQRYGRVHGELSITNSHSERLIRLPLYVGLTDTQQTKVVSVITDAVSACLNPA